MIKKNGRERFYVEIARSILCYPLPDCKGPPVDVVSVAQCCATGTGVSYQDDNKLGSCKSW